jgi:uncharacterized membrane protein YkoI
MFDKFLKMMGAVAVLGAIAVGASAIAGAASDKGTTGATGATSSQGSQAPSGRPADPAKLDHGPGETVLTGDTADKVKKAALDKVSGANVIRVETDNEGSPYEAHLRKSDRTEVTVKVNKDFKATDVITGFGHGPGGRGPGGPPEYSSDHPTDSSIEARPTAGLRCAPV